MLRLSDEDVAPNLSLLTESINTAEQLQECSIVPTWQKDWFLVA